MDLKEIKQILPHREPFLFIDEITELQKGKKITAIKNITGNEDFFKGHFPGNPIMPGVLITEAMAQACCILHKISIGGANKQYLLGSIKVRFKNKTGPGDVLKIEATPLKMMEMGGVFQAKAFVETKLAAQGEMSFICK
jgi:3-hydroxyacyl-[acyl-carrier-protein] dehydratase